MVSNSDLSIVPDYAKSPRDVYVEAMRYFLLSSESLDCLSMKEAESVTTIKDLPSWVPDFSVVIRAPLTFGWWPWSAGDGLGTVHIGLFENHKLELHGHKIGTLRKTSSLSNVSRLVGGIESFTGFLQMIQNSRNSGYL
jgi:hypothetical protein